MSLITWNKAILLAGLVAATLSAQTNPICGPSDNVTDCQNFDNSGTAMLSGTYFVREIQLAGITSAGIGVTTSFGLMGTMTFTPTTDTTGADNGTYTFTGQEVQVTAGTTIGPSTFPSSGTYSGTYRVSANGTLLIQDLVATSAWSVGVVGGAGPHAFVASQPNSLPTSGSGDITIMVGIPVGGTSLSGAYYGSYFDFHGASVSSIRDAFFPFTANNGNLGTLTVTGAGTDLGSVVQTQTLSNVTYSFSSNVGTLNFGGSGSSNFISGTQTFYVSADGSIIVGGTPSDYDLLVGIQALGGTASTASLNGIYYIGGFQDDASVPGETIFEAFYGSTSATGTGTSITHRQLARSDTSVPQDYTTAATGYTIPASGVFAPGDHYQYALGANGTFVGTGQTELYSVVLGMQPAASIQSPTGNVWLNPIGIVNAANSAPITNPVAPNELVTLYGQGMAPGAMPAPAYVFPLPTTLNGVQVYVNGAPAPLLYVSPGVINLLSPSNWYPGNGWDYVTIQIDNNGTYSNAVRVLTSNSAPGVFDFTGSATGQAVVLHANTPVVANSSNPAHPGDVVSIFATGLGLTENQPDIDGSAGVFSPLLHEWQVWMGGVQCDPNQISNYAGLAPGYAGLYQINVTVPSGTPTGDVPLEVWLTEGQTIETTINIAQ